MIRKYIHENKIFFLIISCAILVHVSAFFVLKHLAKEYPQAVNSTFPIAGGGYDSLEYATLGHNILQYGDFSMHDGVRGAAESYRTPGYPLFVAAVEYMTGTINAVPFFQIFLLMVAAYVLYLISLSIFSGRKTIGLVAVGLFVFDPSLIYSSLFVTTECLYTLLLLLAVYFLIQKKLPPRTAYIWAGVFLGLSAYVRPSGLYMSIPVIVWFAWRLFKDRKHPKDRKKVLTQAGVFILAMLVIVSPWIIRNGVKTGVYSFSSLSAYNSLNFNLPLYFSYKDGYTKSIEDIRADLHNQIGNIPDGAQMNLENSALIKKVVWQNIEPHLLGYAVFHVSKSANFFFSPSLKLDVGFVQGFWQGQPADAWHPELSLVNSVLDGRWGDVASWTYNNIIYLPEDIFLLIIFLAGLYWYWRMRKTDAAVLIFLSVFFLALLTSPISNPRYRVPVAPLIYLAGLGGIALVIQKIKSRE